MRWFSIIKLLPQCATSERREQMQCMSIIDPFGPMQIRDDICAEAQACIVFDPQLGGWVCVCVGMYVVNQPRPSDVR